MDNIKNKELHRIAVTAIIYNDGKYLITKRSPSKRVHPNRWTVPGGGLSTDDYVHGPAFHNQWYKSVTTALLREVKEEVGVEISDPKYFTNLTFISPDGTPVLVLSYYAKYVSGDVVLDDDAVEFAWIKPEEAKNYDLIEGIAEEIEEVHQILTKEV